VRALHHILRLQNVEKLPSEDGGRARRGEVGLGGEESKQTKLGCHGAVVSDLANADVVHSCITMYGGPSVGLGDDHEIPPDVSLVKVGRKIRKQHRTWLGLAISQHAETC